MIKFRDFQGTMIEWKMSFLRTYLKEMEKTLKEKEADLIQKWKDLKKEDDSFDYESYLIDCNYEIEQQFGFFYASFIMVIFSFLEDKLDEICTISSIRHGFKIKLKDIRGRGIRRAKLFMKKVCDFTLPNEKLWEELEGIRLIRNCLVHSGGETNDEQVINYARKMGKIKIEENPNTKVKAVRVSKDYCSYATDTIENYLLTLTDTNKDKL